VDFQRDDSQGNPVVVYLRHHNNPQGSLTPLANDAYTLSKDGSTVFTTPLANEPYSKVSGDFNPIHINSYFSDYASLAQSYMVCGQAPLLGSTSRVSLQKVTLIELLRKFLQIIFVFLSAENLKTGSDIH
jgi:MaoC like domain